MDSISSNDSLLSFHWICVVVLRAPTKFIGFMFRNSQQTVQFHLIQVLHQRFQCVRMFCKIVSWIHWFFPLLLLFSCFFISWYFVFVVVSTWHLTALKEIDQCFETIIFSDFFCFNFSFRISTFGLCFCCGYMALFVMVMLLLFFYFFLCLFA